MDKHTLELAEKLAKQFLKKELKKVTDKDEDGNHLQFECDGYYFTQCDDKFIIEVEVHSSYSYMEPPDSDIIEVGQEVNLVKAIMFVAKTNLEMAMNEFCRSDSEERMINEMDEEF